LSSTTSPTLSSSPFARDRGQCDQPAHGASGRLLKVNKAGERSSVYVTCAMADLRLDILELSGLPCSQILRAHPRHCRRCFDQLDLDDRIIPRIVQRRWRP